MSDGQLKHLDYLDGWRGLAITFLLIGHFFPVPGINFGAVGVNFFFVLSGFLMAHLLFVRQVGIPDFYRRRISRIIPAHLALILLTIAYYVAKGHHINWKETLSALFFVNNYILSIPADNEMPFGHIWSLCVEEHSYVLLSIIAVLCRKLDVDAKWVVASFVLFFSTMACIYWTQYNASELEFRLRLRTEISAYGIFISALLVLIAHSKSIPTLPWITYPTLIAVGLGLHWWSVPMPVKEVAGIGIFAITVNLLAGAPVLIKRILAFKPLRLMGVWSFSIYIWQQPFYLLAHRGTIPRLASLAFAIVSGIASYFFLESPIRTYLNRTWGQYKSE